MSAKKVCLIGIIIILVFSFMGCGNYQNDANSKTETKSTKDYIEKINKIKWEDEGKIEYSIIISDEYDWNKKGFYEQAGFAKECVLICRKKGKKAGYKNKDIMVNAKTENENIAFVYHYDENKIGLWIDGKLRDNWLWQ